MASLGHIAVGMAAGRYWAGRHSSHEPGTLVRPMVGFATLALAPDLDVIAFRLGIPYSAPWGHRGATHSVLMAAVLATIAAFATRPDARQSRIRLWGLGVAVAASHGLLDTLTDGGLGVALWWPFSNARFFARWTPIPVAPIGAGMLTTHGLWVVIVEALQFAPVWVWAVWPRKGTGT